MPQVGFEPTIPVFEKEKIFHAINNNYIGLTYFYSNTCIGLIGHLRVDNTFIFRVTIISIHWPVFTLNS
jgi:hypothetical protein